MKLLTFFENGTYKLGVHTEEGEGILDIAAAERVYLQPGDEVTIEIEKLGSITNTMVAER
ncbi:hypothetical protein [Paenibacillus paridis]|uniref:hypothetical protein n=1 Tax=Paenibacillus paridis TaxID=2583376 RepID=UPI00308316E4